MHTVLMVLRQAWQFLAGSVFPSPPGMTESNQLCNLGYWRLNLGSTRLSFVALGKHSAVLCCPFIKRSRL